MWGQWQFCHSVINTRKTSLSTQEYWINIVHWHFQLSVHFTFKGSNLGSPCQKTLPHHTLSLRKEKKFWTKWRLNFIPKCWVQRPWGSTRQKKRQEDPKMILNDVTLRMSVLGDLGHRSEDGAGCSISRSGQGKEPSCSRVTNHSCLLALMQWTGACFTPRKSSSDITDPVLQSSLQACICSFLSLLKFPLLSLNKINWGH